MPDIQIHRLLMPFLHGTLSKRMTDECCRAMLAHPHTDVLIEHVMAQGSDDSLDTSESQQVIVAIGPERGWIDRELDSFAAIGFAGVSLGNRVLRVETAVTVALAQASLLQRLNSSDHVEADTRSKHAPRYAMSTHCCD